MWAHLKNRLLSEAKLMGVSSKKNAKSLDFHVLNFSSPISAKISVGIQDSLELVMILFSLTSLCKD